MRRHGWPPPCNLLRGRGRLERSTHQEDQNRKGDGEKMLAKNIKASVAAVAVAMITGLVVALWVALMPAPAQAQVSDELQLLRIKATNIEDAEPELYDEAQIKVDGTLVWSSNMRPGDVKILTGVPPQRFSGT